MTYQPGRHFLQVPGPTNIPDRILRAIAQPVLDHRGPAWNRLQAEVFERIRPIFKTRQPVMIFPASGTGGWESALVNSLSPGDSVLTSADSQPPVPDAGKIITGCLVLNTGRMRSKISAWSLAQAGPR